MSNLLLDESGEIWKKRITRMATLAGRMSGGIDFNRMIETVFDEACDEIGADAVALFASSDNGRGMTVIRNRWAQAGKTVPGERNVLVRINMESLFEMLSSTPAVAFSLDDTDLCSWKREMLGFYEASSIIVGRVMLGERTYGALAFRYGVDMKWEHHEADLTFVRSFCAVVGGYVTRREGQLEFIQRENRSKAIMEFMPAMTLLFDASGLLLRLNLAARQYAEKTSGYSFDDNTHCCAEMFCGIKEPTADCPVKLARRDGEVHSVCKEVGGRRLIFMARSVPERSGGPGMVVEQIIDVTDCGKQWYEPSRPAGEAAVEASSKEGVAESPVENPGGAKLIMVVDDIEMNRRLLGVMLRKLGFSYIAAESGAEAIGLLKNHQVSLILTDIWMPGMSGEVMAQKIAGEPATSGIPIVAITADTQRVEAECFREVIHKPIKLDALSDVILRNII
ncbi:MAG: response regulator [Victivallaceae bacterium]|nr:response regulator [Victivallaceae bacterium]